MFSFHRFNLFFSPDGNGGEPAPINQPIQPTATQQSATPEQIATALVSALDARTKRTETSIVKSFAEQYGISESDVNTILTAEKARRDAKLPDAAQAQIDAAIKTANDRLISAEVKVICSALNIVDADAAVLLMDKSSVKVDEKGTVTGVKEALEALVNAKPYLTKQPDNSAAYGTGSVGNFPRGNGATDYQTQLNEARKRGDGAAACSIINEAMQKGIVVR